MPRPYSTKRPKPIPAEFEQFFIANGWTRCNNVFGKRETLRYVTALGVERLSAARHMRRTEARIAKVKPRS